MPLGGLRGARALSAPRPVRGRAEPPRRSDPRRHEARRRRRSGNLRYRAPRFDDRRRPAGWLAPSLRHRVEGTIDGFTTGDLVRAVIPRGKYAGTHIGRVAVRANGCHGIPVPGGHAGTSHQNLRLLQRADGYAYGTRFEKPVEPRSIGS
ncbi:RRXRR domain-containing protein [Streptomyces mirabilis]|uniref:RRXRR domain-containing protein n=1 Tax=Streptomyces mirabilis TaxID=68239 RepID=UPI003BEF0F11